MIGIGLGWSSCRPEPAGASTTPVSERHILPGMDHEEIILEEALENLREAAQRIRAISNRMRATGMRKDPNHHDLSQRVASALAMTEAAGMEAKRKLGRG